VTVSGNIVRIVGNTLLAGYVQIPSIAGGAAISSGIVIQTVVKNLSGNNTMWIGPSGVNSGIGYILLAGETTPDLKTNNLANVFAYAFTSGQNLSYIATNQ